MGKPLNLTPEERARRSAAMKARWKDPAFRERIRSIASAFMTQLQADPARRARSSARMKALNADPIFKAKSSARMKARGADPAVKAEFVKRMRKQRRKTKDQ
jgi:hypothetical protein